jgi:hypothetical protein
MELHKDNLYIKSLIESTKPFFIGRIAGVELKVAYKIITNQRQDIDHDLVELERNAGIHITTLTSLQAYAEALTNSYKSCTGIAEWELTGKVFALTGIGQEFITRLTPTIPKINARALEPYYFQDSWMEALKGKRILIVHPFIKTLQKQISNFRNIFPGRKWFEDCEFVFAQPPLTLAGNHREKDWQEHYTIFIEHLKNLTTNTEFDIALVAGGGYGMLIADFIFRNLGKSTIYVGGALQLFFGVIGKRWFDNKEILQLVNDDWIRPVNEDKPPNFIKVEKGCYW